MLDGNDNSRHGVHAWRMRHDSPGPLTDGPGNRTHHVDWLGRTHSQRRSAVTSATDRTDHRIPCGRCPRIAATGRRTPGSTRKPKPPGPSRPPWNPACCLSRWGRSGWLLPGLSSAVRPPSGQRSPRLKLIASNGGMPTGSLPVSVSSNSHWPFCCSNGLQGADIRVPEPGVSRAPRA